MTDPVTFVIGGEPAAKGRARMTRGGIAYTPAKTRAYEAHGRLAAQEAMQGRAPIAGAVAMTVGVWLPIPASFSKKKRAAALIGEVLPVTRPDVDNYAKAVLDCCNSIVFGDDRQVAVLQVAKRYGLVPQMVVTVRPA